MDPERLIFFLVAASCLILHVCASSPFSDQEEAQLSGLNHLIGLEVDAILTCNLVIFSDLVNVSTAQQNCQNLKIGNEAGGELVKIPNENRNNQVARLLELAYPIIEQPQDHERITPTRWAWAGLKMKTYHEPGYYDHEEWEYADGTQPEEYQSWSQGYPDYTMKEFLKVNHEGGWVNSYGSPTHPYVCQYHGKYMVSSEHKVWNDAKEACEGAGMDFAAVHSDDDLVELLRAMEHFMGPRKEIKWDDDNWIWVGGYDAENEGEWKWTNGKTVEWDIKWEPKAGNDDAVQHFHLDGQDFLALSRWGTADDSYGEDKPRPFACQCPGS